MNALVEREAKYNEEKKLFSCLVDLLSYEKITFNGECLVACDLLSIIIWQNFKLWTLFKRNFRKKNVKIKSYDMAVKKSISLSSSKAIIKHILIKIEYHMIYLIWFLKIKSHVIFKQIIVMSY